MMYLLLGINRKKNYENYWMMLIHGIQILNSIIKSVKVLPFLDVLITNNNGILSTSVYHKPAAEPYVTPFISDHPRHVFANIIQTSLTRAIRYSSTFQAFDYERRYINTNAII